MLISDIAEFMEITTGRLHQIIGEREIPVEKESNRSFINYTGAKVLFKIPFEKKLFPFKQSKVWWEKQHYVILLELEPHCMELKSFS